MNSETEVTTRTGLGRSGKLSFFFFNAIMNGNVPGSYSAMLANVRVRLLDRAADCSAVGLLVGKTPPARLKDTPVMSG